MRRFFLGISRGIDQLNTFTAWIADWMVLLAVLISAANATARYLANYSSNAFIEVQWYLFGGIIFLGCSYTLKVNEHVRVDLIYGNVSGRGRLLIDIFGLIFFLLPATIFLGWLSWPVFVDAFRSGEGSSNFGGLIRWPILLVLPVGFALLTLQGISELIKRFIALRDGDPIVAAYVPPTQ